MKGLKVSKEALRLLNSGNGGVTIVDYGRREREVVSRREEACLFVGGYVRMSCPLTGVEARGLVRGGDLLGGRTTRLEAKRPTFFASIQASAEKY